MGFEMPITVTKVIEGIQTTEYVLPAIQREFVWNAEQIEKLFDSLLRGYPVGSFLFWRIKQENVHDYQFYRFMDKYHQREYRHNEPIHLVGKHPVVAVLDGQQRLTALNIGLKGTYADKLPYYRVDNPSAYPPRKLYLNLHKSPDDPEFAYEFKMLRDQDVKNNNGKYWFPVGKILEFEDIPMVFNYCVEQGLTQEGDKFPSNTLMRLWQVMKAQALINYFLEEEQDLDKVLNIFIRVNSGGTILSYSDMLLSIATAQWREKDARKEITNLVDDLNKVGEGFNFNKDFVLKACLVLSDISAIEFRVSNFNKANMSAIEGAWDGIDRALRLTARLLASWGYSWQTLVSHNAVIPLAYYLHKKGCPLNLVESGEYKQDRDNMRRWLASAILKRTFSGQPDNVLRPIRRIIQGQHDVFPIDAIFADLKATPKSMAFDEASLEGLLAYRYGQDYTFSVLALLYPWLKFDQHFHIDHIFPKAMFTTKALRERGIPSERWPQWQEHVNDLANLQLLQGLPNQEKSDKEFEEWLYSYCATDQSFQAYRQNHLIPDVDLRFENFPEFLKAREELILGKLAELLGVERRA